MDSRAWIPYNNRRRFPDSNQSGIYSGRAGKPSRDGFQDTLGVDSIQGCTLAGVRPFLWVVVMRPAPPRC